MVKSIKCNNQTSVENLQPVAATSSTAHQLTYVYVQHNTTTVNTATTNILSLTTHSKAPSTNMAKAIAKAVRAFPIRRGRVHIRQQMATLAGPVQHARQGIQVNRQRRLLTWMP